MSETFEPAAQFQNGKGTGIQQEREAIVKWIVKTYPGDDIAMSIVEDIIAGEHLKEV